MWSVLPSSAANEKAFRSFRNSRFGGETAAAMRR
jgi:hypothetical protein